MVWRPLFGNAVGMGYPRAQLVVPGVAGTFHCVTRCVRRAFLCGDDQLTRKSFTHRKAWLEDRLIEPAGAFSISVLACAVMSNHLHAVLQVDPAVANQWADLEVAERWVRVFPARVDGDIDHDA